MRNETIRIQNEKKYINQCYIIAFARTNQMPVIFFNLTTSQYEIEIQTTIVPSNKPTRGLRLSALNKLECL